MMKQYQSFTLCFLLFMGCTKSGNTQNNSAPAAFVLPEIPVMLTAATDRANYLTVHYWDRFDFQDTAAIHQPDVTEQAFVDYIDLFSHVEQPTVSAAIQNLMHKAEQEPTGTMLRYFLTTAESYLHDPNSPMRNEEFYIPVAQYITTSESPLLTIAEKAPAEYHLKMMLKNRAGAQATNFSYTLSSGKTGTLHTIHSEYTLLLFYNPDCHTCSEMITTLSNSALLNSLQESGRLKILAFYPYQDLAVWKKKLPDIPAAWLNAYDPHTIVEDRQLYDLRAIPTLYLLDKDKTVILKDAELQQVLKTLQAID
jgi:thiol-disulfide isomerase/thioredoxin